jgi:hypothetical protein
MGFFDCLYKLFVSIVGQMCMYHEKGMNDAGDPESYTQEHIKDRLKRLPT